MNDLVGYLCLGALVALVWFFISEASSAARVGNRPLYVRLLGAVTPGSLPFSQRENPSRDRSPLLEAALIAGLGIVGFRLLQETYSFLKDIKWDAITTTDKQAITRFTDDLERLRGGRERLERAQELVAVGDPISVDQGALLASAVLEMSLRHLQEQCGVILKQEQSEGLVGLAIALRDAGRLSISDYREVRKHVSAVRNKVMHGEFEMDATEVQNEIAFVRRLVDEHGI